VFSADAAGSSFALKIRSLAGLVLDARARTARKACMSQPIPTTLNRTWLLKTGAFLVVLVVLGLWGLYDGLYLYPSRGMQDASFQFSNFLKEADKAGRLNPSTIAAADPKAAHAELEAKVDELRKQAAGSTSDARKASMDVAKYEWLESLRKVWQLNTKPEYLGTISGGQRLYLDLAKGEGFTLPAGMTPSTGGAQATTLNSQKLLDEMTKYWNTNPKVSPLSSLDLLFQWFIVIAGAVGSLWILVTMLRAKAMASKITFEPDEQRLTLPGGVSIVPSEINDIDKRKWNKFYCTLETSKGNHEIDLLRYVPLEAWILTMEKTRFPERAAEAERQKAEQERQAAEATTALADASADNHTPSTPNT
jgi:hypothetical protein